MFGKEGIGPAVVKLNHLPPFTPCSRAVNMRSVQTSGSTQPHRALISPACLAFGTAAGVASIGLSISHPPSCAPWLHTHYRRFDATMGALTPARLSPPGRSPRFMCTAFRPFRLQPPHAPPPPL